MGLARHLVPTLFLTAFLPACSSFVPPGPILLYPPPVRSPGELSVIEVVRTQPDGGHATIRIQTITRVEADSADVVYQVRGGTAWSPPEHFGGPPVTQPQRASGDPRAIPYHFELLPGNYRVDFLYVPVKDPLGWTHRLREEQTAWLECRPGLVYRLEGKLLEGGARWVLAVDEEPAGEGEAGD